MSDDEDRQTRTGRWADGGSRRRFTATKNFEHPPFAYAEGLAYTADSKALDELVDGWLEKGLVTLGGGASKMTGKGN